MGKRLEAVSTPISRDELVNGLLVAWPSDCSPTRAAVRLAGAQIDLEVGYVKTGPRKGDLASICFNLGNIKGRIDDPDRCHTFYPCGEELAIGYALLMAKNSGGLVKIVRTYKVGQKDMASVRIVPDHPACCFRAFSDLPSGLVDHISFLRRLAGGRVWSALSSGEPAAFARALREARYYTASESVYARVLAERLPKFSGSAVRDLTWGDVT